MKLYLSNTTTKFVGDSTERNWLSNYLSFPDSKAHFTGGPSRRQYFNHMSDTFHSGFVPMIQKAAADEQIQVEVQDTRTPSEEPRLADEAGCSWLRDYQLAALDRVLQAKRGILWVPTGGGKTEIAVGAALRLPNTNFLFVVHKTQLMEQAAERYERRTGLPAGRIGEGKWSVERFTCATFQSIYAGLKARDQQTLALLQYTEGVIVDECHTLPADSFWKTINQMHRAYWRIGLSGTPLSRDDSKSLNAIGLLGPVVYRIRPEVLIDAGVLCAPEIKLVRHQVPGEYRQKANWQSAYKSLVETSELRNALVVKLAEATPKPALVFVKGIDHGKHISKLLWKEGIKNEFVWGDHSTEYRTGLIRRLESGALDVLVCSTVFNEGVDIPCLSSAVIAAGGKSAIAAIQRVGRTLRVTAGKSPVVQVWDLLDEGCGCRKLTEEWGTGDVGAHKGCIWLERHARARKKAYESEGFRVEVIDSIP